LTSTAPWRRNARRALLVAVVTSAALLLPTAQPTSAATPTHVLTSAGADVTDYAMAAVLKAYASDPANTDGDATANIPSLPEVPYTVPADSTCEARTYVVAGSPPTTYTAPASAGQGKNALKDPTNLANGCIDIARSSSGPAVGEPAGFRYFGFAKDAMTWAAFAGGKAPASLTKSQIKGIYDCTYTDWSEVGGKPGKIVRYFTQPGSGAGQLFRTNILDGFDPTTVSSASCPAVVGIQQSHANLVAVADRPYAILPYTTSGWIAQANGVSPNFRAGVIAKPITIGGVPVSTISGPKFGKYTPNTAVYGGTFPGVFTLYNVLHADSVAFLSARGAVGYDTSNPVSGAKSPLCSGKLDKVLRTYGMLPFSADANGLTCTFSTPS
jgi:phosphate transport system substrate-binding protein